MEPKTPGRRSPESAERVRDAKRTKRKLKDAALTEFAANGYDGARVGEIAARAGVNKQLISYYFGGKEGLYRAMQREWLDDERDQAGPDVPAQDVMRWYLRDSLKDPRIGRLAMWQALSGDLPEEESQEDAERDIEEMRERQRRGEIAADLDPAAVQIAMMGMTLAPVIFRGTARRLFGVDIDDPEFETRYGDTLSRILARLAENTEHHPERNTES
ncbi:MULTISPECIES: TetR/AcrR family transcriptional regulator [Glycomyces]|uniref:AcrR family transcriptional regulator n=2 Tax=Glycomyces TaxID=58113 RepID=A0A9X3PMI2_9ACTN|nr:TetR/AcrR family transcriptional regulator [Glycomyces lechevalierae]MDA1388206.1 TetR family transcriptional regulator [Glycomyces lechevalierae]MDR7337351.1 AcrR family transcriptional regulator [Glycomyces lechevalierae]